MIEKIHLLAILWSIKTHTSTITKLKNYIGNISIIYTKILPEEKYQKIEASYFYGNLLAPHDFTRRIIEYPLAPAPLSLHWPADRSFLDPVHTQPGTLGNGDFFLRIRLPSTCTRRFRAPKTEVFKYALQGGEFWNRRFIVCVWTGENEGFQIRWRHALVQDSLLRTYDSKTLHGWA